MTEALQKHTLLSIDKAMSLVFEAKTRQSELEGRTPDVDVDVDGG